MSKEQEPKFKLILRMNKAYASLSASSDPYQLTSPWTDLNHFKEELMKTCNLLFLIF